MSSPSRSARSAAVSSPWAAVATVNPARSMKTTVRSMAVGSVSVMARSLARRVRARQAVTASANAPQTMATSATLKVGHQPV